MIEYREETPVEKEQREWQHRSYYRFVILSSLIIGFLIWLIINVSQYRPTDLKTSFLCFAVAVVVFAAVGVMFAPRSGDDDQLQRMIRRW